MTTTATDIQLRSPYPWFGGKSRIAPQVWQRFGDTPNFVEPFFGSGAMLLARPGWPWEGNRIETVNDLDCFVANFWRALQHEPEEVAMYADWPVNEADLHARHLWLTNNAEFRKRMHAEPEHYDCRVAGWWVWGICQWIGSGWCEHPEWQQLPHLGNAGRGVHRPSQKLPHLGNAGRGEIYDYMDLLAERLKRVRVCCGDWSRVLGPTVTEKQGLTAVFLDPPYSAEAGRDESLYAVEDLSVAHDVRAWCLENGDNKKLRIALAGYDVEHTELEQHGWTTLQWKARGGYANQGENKHQNSKREVIWFSPHCLSQEKRAGELF